MICCDLEDNHNLMKLYKHKLKTWGIQMDGFHKEIHNKGISDHTTQHKWENIQSRLCNKNGCARKVNYFLCICRLVVLNALTRLITLILYSGHQFLHCTVLLCVKYNLKLGCLFSSSFAIEANLAYNDNEKWESFKYCKPGNYVTFSLEQVGHTGIPYK